MKRFLSLLLVAMLALGAFTAACAETPDIAGKYYAYSFYADGYGNYGFFFHFYEADPVLGAVYYAGLNNNQVCYAGLYTVDETPFAYSCYATRDAKVNAEAPVTGEAPYTVRFLDWDGNEIDTCGWDGEVLYNNCKTIIGSGSGDMLYADATADEQYKELFEGEVGQSYLGFVATDDPTCTVDLGHNMTYTDMMVYFVDGGWTMSYDDAGNAVYDLTPADDTEDPARLIVAPDRATAVYVNADGEETAMVNKASTGPKALYIGKDTHHIDAYNMDAEVILTLFDDNTCELVAALMGNSSVVDAGTYTMNEDHSIDFVFEKAGAQTAKLDMSVMGVVLNYVNENTEIGAMNVNLNIGKAEEAPAPAR